MKFNLPTIWAKKKFGIVSITPVNVRAMLRRFLAGNGKALANAAEGWHRDGVITCYPTDLPYLVRYLMVQFAPIGTAQPAGIPYTLPPQALCQQYATNRLAVPLGIATDEPNNTALESVPISTNVQLLGGGQGRTQVGITDGIVNFNTLLVGSSTTAGYLTTLPATPGSYWSPGLSLSTSEGAGAQIEFDPRVQVVNVDVIT